MPTQAFEVIMPKVDMDMTTGKIVAWHVREGDAVNAGDPLFDIETDKSAMEVESPGTGYLQHVSAEPGDEIPIGQTIAWIVPSSDSAGSNPVRPVAVAARDVRVRATPAARRLARDLDIDLSELQGTGCDGRVQRDDVGLAAEQQGERSVLHDRLPLSLQGGTGSLNIVRAASAGERVTVFCIHGFAGDCHSWRMIEPSLEGHPLLKLELPGHGRSPRHPVSGFADLAKQVVEAFDQVESGRFHIIGHSLGGALAVALTEIRPRKVASITLIAPAGLGPEIAGEIVFGIARARREESLAPWLKRTVFDSSMIDDAYTRAAMNARRDQGFRASQLELAETLFADSVQTFDLIATLHRIKAPLQIIWGKADRVIPWKHALEAPGDAALHLFERVGHCPHQEAPGRVGRLISRFIKGSG